MNHQLKPMCSNEELHNICKYFQKRYSKLQEGGEQMKLIVSLNLLQHVKHLSEISAVFELNHTSIFTTEQLAAQRWLLWFWFTGK